MIRAGVAQDDLKRTTTYSYRLPPKPSGRPASSCRLRKPNAFPFKPSCMSAWPLVEPWEKKPKKPSGRSSPERNMGVMARMDDSRSLEDGMKSGKHHRLAFAAYPVKGSVADQSAFDLHARYGSLPIRASAIASPQCIQAQESNQNKD